MKKYLYWEKALTRDVVERYLGCSIKDFIKYMPQHSWPNWKRRGLHLDHIQPLGDAKSEDDLIARFHYTNYQFLKCQDNIQKGCIPNFKNVKKIKHFTQISNWYKS